jgi:hypothetical protein
MANAFDELAKALAEGVTRRGALRLVGGGFAGALLASVGLGKAYGSGSCGPVDCNHLYPGPCGKCFCATTVEDVDTCFYGGRCFACRSSADCVAAFGPGSACVATLKNCGCQRQGMRACVFPCV